MKYLLPLFFLMYACSKLHSYLLGPAEFVAICDTRIENDRYIFTVSEVIKSNPKADIHRGTPLSPEANKASDPSWGQGFHSPVLLLLLDKDSWSFGNEPKIKKYSVYSIDNNTVNGGDYTLDAIRSDYKK